MKYDTRNNFFSNMIALGTSCIILLGLLKTMTLQYRSRPRPLDAITFNEGEYFMQLSPNKFVISKHNMASM